MNKVLGTLIMLLTFQANLVNAQTFDKTLPIKGTFVKADTTITIYANESFDDMWCDEIFTGNQISYGLPLSQIHREGKNITIQVDMFDTLIINGELNNNILTGKLTIISSYGYRTEFLSGVEPSAPSKSVSNENGDEIPTGPTGQYGPEPPGVALIVSAIIFLSLFIALSYYLRKLFAKLYQTPIEPLSDISAYLPMVRISRRSVFWRHRVVILYDDTIAAFKKWRWRSIAALHEVDTKEMLNKFEGIGSIKTIGADEVKKILVSPYRFYKINRIKFKTNKGSFALVLPNFESDNFIKALNTTFPGKVKYQNTRMWLRCVIGILFTLAIGTVIYFSQETSWLQQAMCWALAVTVLLIVPIVIAKYDLHKISAARTIKPKKAKDLSHNKPLRSNALAIALRLAVLAFVIYWLWYNATNPTPLDINFAMACVILGSVLLLSIALAQRSTDKLRKDDMRKPVLYLRSFLDDKETTLNPCTYWSTLLGVDPPYYWLTDLGLEDGLRYKIGKTVIKYGYSFWPTRLIRLFFSITRDTSEEQLTNYFKHQGLVVAIGKPGEKVTTLGASRMYVTNEEWQQTVLDLLKESQTILLQPSTTEGVWWEVDKVLKEVAPENIIMCMVNYRKRQEAYEGFYKRIKTLRPDLNIPRSLGNEKRISFITFKNDWTPEVHQLKYSFILGWPFTGNALNLKKTFSNYFEERNAVNVPPKPVAD